MAGEDASPDVHRREPSTEEAVPGDAAYRDAKVAHLLRRAAEPGDPVVVWAMGKSGTSAVAAGLRDAGAAPVFQIHSVLARSLSAVEQEYLSLDPRSRPTHIWDAQALLLGRAPTPAAPWTVVTTVRDPLQVVVAGFFQSAGRRGHLGPDTTVASLRDAFGDGWNPPLEWFDVQMPQVDVYSRAFDPLIGRATIDLGYLRLLLLRQEDLGAPATAEALRAHVGTPRAVVLRPTNVGAEKSYADLYRRFQEEVRPPASLVAAVCESRLVRHFYSEGEIEDLTRRWS